MTRVRGYGARRKSWRPGAAMVAAGVLGVAFLGLWAAGFINPLAPFSKTGPAAPDTRGKIAIPVSAVPIPAYTKVVRDHLWNANTGSFALIYLRPEQVTPEVKRDMSDIIGRVMDHDKPAAYAFTEADFLPKGTRPGIVGGIPSGKRAMRVTLDKVPGLVGLLPGDRFDLVSTLPIEAGGAAMGGAGLYGKQLDLQARLSNWQKQATVRVIVQSGEIVQPAMIRQVPVVSNGLTTGMTVRTKPVQEAVIAVTPAEVPHLTEALAVGAEITCVPRSGRPDEPKATYTPELSPRNPYTGAVPGSGAGFTAIETISGTRRDMVTAPVKR